jgi:hypothetical protein
METRRVAWIVAGTDANDETSQVLPRKEVIRRLRDRGEPILLFGETELQAFQRLRRSEILEPELNKVNFSMHEWDDGDDAVSVFCDIFSILSSLGFS